MEGLKRFRQKVLIICSLHFVILQRGGLLEKVFRFFN